MRNDMQVCGSARRNLLTMSPRVRATCRIDSAALEALRRVHALFYPRDRLSRRQSRHEEIVSARSAEAGDLLLIISETAGGNIRLQPRSFLTGEFNQSVVRTEQRDVT
jgi:hypothetical protein